MYSWTVLTKQAQEEATESRATTVNRANAVIETTKSGYLFRDAFSAFRESIKKKQYKKSHYWLAELCVSGEVKKTWNILLDACIHTIPFVTPGELVRLYRRMLRMKQKIASKESTDIPLLHMLHDCLIILLWSKEQKRVIAESDVKLLSKIKVPQDPRSHRKAPLDSIHPIVIGTLSHTNDPPNLLAGGHELIHAVLRKDIPMIRWWLSWILLWTPSDSKGHPRPHRCSNQKHEKDWIWGMWDLAFALAQHIRLPKDSIDIIRHCHSVFSLEYTTGSKKKRFPLLLLSFFLCSTDTWKPVTLPHLPQRITFGLGLKSFYEVIMKTRQPPLKRP